MKQKYIYIVVFIAVVIVCFGFLFPFLFSSNTDAGLLAGYALMASFIWYIGWNLKMFIQWIINYYKTL